MTTTSTQPSILASLRSMTPQRVVTFAESLRIAELQAGKLAAQIGDEHGIQEIHLRNLPRITVDYANIPVSGMSHWNGQQWVITLAKGDSPARQRFTMLHEFKHIIDHGSTQILYRGNVRMTPTEQAEAAADFFAGCALVGRRELKSAWGNRMQNIPDLAAHFGVSREAIAVRLAQTGLDRDIDEVPAPRCARPISTPAGHAQRFRRAYPNHTRERSVAA